ncbi:hypothetical protein B0I26_101204 [Anoxybacillus vitaminiphilus]|uniref:Copper amine oxidase-like protein n=1 Tax=Paranoxybacillus vitaminiphilus TaxID=581036 RepID=A0A327YZ91_9BACL|nr:hypothetical protein [Anoxybacillus vitaminiphilus]RAK23249.1 hypothetical protein B0I26_101204 [Anoxybacillus vitaminiphilus]
MLRVAFFTILLLLGVSGGIVYTQWNDYQHEIRTKANEPLVHHIIARYNGESLEVQHRLSGIIKDNYEVIIPNIARNFSCKSEKNQKCVFYSKNEKRFVKTKGIDELEMQYSLPLAKKKDVIWLENWSAAFISEQRQQIYVEMIDFTKNNGIWIAGAKLEGQTKRDSFTYYTWAQKDIVSFPLYFQSFQLKRTVSENIEVYAGRKIDIRQWTKTKAGRIADVPSLTIVVSPVRVKYVSPTLIVMPEKESFTSVQADYVRAYYRSLFSFHSPVQEWVWDFLTAMMLNQEAMTPKAKQVSNELNRELTNEEKKEFLDAVFKQKGKELTLQFLDRALGDVRHGTTTFFADNSQRENLSPLLFKQNTLLFVNEQQLKGVSPITRHGEKLLPFVEIMTKLGYQVRQSGDAVFINKGYNSWRFFVNSSIYMHGNDRFDDPSIIIHKIDNKLYISEKMIQEWFYIEVRERDQAIYINER